MSAAELIDRLRTRRTRVHDLGGVGYEPDQDCLAAADALQAHAARIAGLEARIAVYQTALELIASGDLALRESREAARLALKGKTNGQD